MAKERGKRWKMILYTSAISPIYKKQGHVRSICKMYAKDYTEEVDNTIIIQKLSKVLFEEINSFMVGWFNEAQVELSFVSYMKIMWPMLQSYFGKE